MNMHNIPFGTTDWSGIDAVEHSAQAGKGHILLCLSGELHTELADGRRFTLSAGMSYQVADNAEPHRSTAPLGAKLFIVD
jgi:mannose-6-phosphate isomerase class I